MPTMWRDWHMVAIGQTMECGVRHLRVGRRGHDISVKGRIVKRHRLTAKQREDLWVVGSVVWFANGTIGTQCLAEGPKDECECYADIAEHPIEEHDVLHPEKPPRMLAMTKAAWSKLIDDCRRADGLPQ